MTIFTIVSPVFVISGLDRLGGSAAAQPVPLYELIMAVIAIAVWALAVALIAAWLRARERNAARAHIRSILIVRQDGGASSGMEQRQMENRTRRRQAWARPVQQI
jgi:hypothetical protein